MVLEGRPGVGPNAGSGGCRGDAADIHSGQGGTCAALRFAVGQSWSMAADSIPAPAPAPSPRGTGWHVRRALASEPAPVLLRAGIAVLVDIIVVFVASKYVLLAMGHPQERLTHAVLPAVFGGMFAFLGSLGGSWRSGVSRGAGLAIVALPLTLLAIVVRDQPLAAGLALAAAAAGAGFLAWHGEPWGTLGSLLLYMFFVPLVFGAGLGVPLKYLLASFAVMLVATVVLRSLAAAIPKHRRPARAPATDEPRSSPQHPFALLSQPQIGRLRRTTLRSAIALGVGAVVMSATRDHNSVWVLMTLIALVPPALPLTMNRILQRLAGTAVAMVVLTVVDVALPPGPLRMTVLAAGIVVTIAFLKRSYAISVVGVSVAAVIGYAQVAMPLGEALLWRGLDTVVGGVIAIVVALIIPIGARPHPVWSAADLPAAPGPDRT